MFKSVLFITKEVTELPSKQAGLEVSGPLPWAGLERGFKMGVIERT